jgi:hypothetical protein
MFRDVEHVVIVRGKRAEKNRPRAAAYPKNECRQNSLQLANGDLANSYWRIDVVRR